MNLICIEFSTSDHSDWTTWIRAWVCFKDAQQNIWPCSCFNAINAGGSRPETEDWSSRIHSKRSATANGALAKADQNKVCVTSSYCKAILLTMASDILTEWENSVYHISVLQQTDQFKITFSSRINLADDLKQSETVILWNQEPSKYCPSQLKTKLKQMKLPIHNYSQVHLQKVINCSFNFQEIGQKRWPEAQNGHLIIRNKHETNSFTSEAVKVRLH